MPFVLNSVVVILLLRFRCLASSSQSSVGDFTFNGYQLLKTVPHTTQQLVFLKTVQGLHGRLPSNSSLTGGFIKHVRRECRVEKMMNSWLSASVIDVPSLIWGKRGSIRTLQRILIRKGLTARVIIEHGNRFFGQIPSVDMLPSQFRSGMTVAQFNLLQYHRMEEIDLLLLALQREYPDLIELLTIGQSFEGRNITVVKISRDDNRERKGFWLEFGIHAREWISHATGLHFLVHLVTSNVVETKSMLNNVNWYIVPASNPDGYVFTWHHVEEKMIFIRKSKHFRIDSGEKLDRFRLNVRRCVLHGTHQ